MKTQRNTALALLLAIFISSFADAQSVFKRKWSPQAKGTAIGAGVGGVAGAIIHKRDRKVGTGVGLAVGAAAGYGVGKVIDNRHKKAAAAARAAENREFAARTARNDDNRELRAGTSNRKSSVGAAAPVAAAGAVGAAALAQNSLLAAPEPVTIPLVRNGYLLNTAYGEPNTAYPTSEYRRKSW